MRRDRPTPRNIRQSEDPEIRPDRNAQRRAVYHSDPEAAERARRNSREAYSTDRPAKLAGGLLTNGEAREVIAGEMDHPVSVQSYSVPEAALALGRGVATIRRWIEADKIPAPYLRDVATNHRVYSAGELQVIARAIAQHERDFSYLTQTSQHIVESIHQAVHAYRSEFI